MTEQTRPLEKPESSRTLVLQPRFIRFRDAPAYLGMDRSKFNEMVRPFLTEIPLGKQAVAFEKVEIDAWADHYIQRNGRRPRAQLPEDDLCQIVTRNSPATRAHAPR